MQMHGGHVVFQISRKIQMIAIGVLIILSIPVLVDSQTHGLVWGFDSGEKFYFRETRTSYDSNSTVMTRSFEYYLIAEDHLIIPDPLTHFPIDREDAYYYNGTEVRAGGLYFAVPIGNWELLRTTYLSSYSSSYDTINIINEESIWGFETTKDLEFMVQAQTSLFSKSDGVLASLSYQVTIGIGHTTTFLVERVPPPPNIIIIGFTSSISIILIAIVGVYLFKTERRSEKKEEGEKGAIENMKEERNCF